MALYLIQLPTYSNTRYYICIEFRIPSGARLSKKRTCVNRNLTE